MATVNQILKTKDTAIIYVSPDNMVIDALRIMADKNIGAIVVMENGKLKGIFSERDYARKIVLKAKASGNTPIRDIMTTYLYTVTPDTTIDECMEIMSERNIRHLPVVENDELMGLISIGDLVRFIIEEQKLTIKTLEGYISGQ
jgi:CBS domain-containing protein